MAGKPENRTTTDGRQIICENRRARHNYAIESKFEAGLVLTGTEVKACRAGKAHLNDAFVQVIRGEALLLGGHIDEYSYGHHFNHTPVRSRKLLMHRREIDKLEFNIQDKGLSAVPLTLYFSPGGRVKVEIGVGKGKSRIDKRQDIKSREAKREIDRTMSARNKR